MPTYSYACEHCGHKFDLFQNITAPVLRKCPQCGTISLKRLIGSGAGIIFKGSGFYCTDYRGDSYTKAANAETGGAKDKVGEAKDAKTTPVAKSELPKAGKKKSA